MEERGWRRGGREWGRGVGGWDKDKDEEEEEEKRILACRPVAPR